MATKKLVHSYTPHGAALKMMKSKASELVLSGSAGTGKTRAALEKLHYVALANPGMRGLIVRKTLSSLGSTGLETWRKKVIPESVQAGHVSFYGGSASEAAQYRYTNGSAIVIGGMDKSTKIMSSEYDFIYVQEATELTITDWEHCNSRLRNNVVGFQQLLADCNPDKPSHWLKQRANIGKTVMLESVHEDNPTLFNPDGSLTTVGKAYIERLDSLTGVRYLRLRKGLWVAAEGLVYDEFDPTVHLVDPFKIPMDWTRYWVVDFGTTHPFVLQCWAVDPDGRLFMYREIYKTQTLIEDHAKAILAIVAPNGKWIEPKPLAVITDHDAGARLTLDKHLGMGSTPAHKNVDEGIEAVKSRMRKDKTGKPRVAIMRGALVSRDTELEQSKNPMSTEEEFTGYIWNQAKDAPVKEFDDGMDCMRYMVAHLDLRGATRVRWAA